MRRCIHLLFLLIFSEAKQGCHICGHRGNNALVHPKETCLQHGHRNCKQIAMDIMRQDVNSSDCAKFQYKYRLCCNNIIDLNCVEKSSFVTVDPPNPSDISYVGPYKQCNICGPGGFWTKNSHVLNMLYIGPGTCETYYIHGLKGGIPNHLCDPLQFFVRDTCGCKTRG